jgi:hypothetical protein
VPTATSSPTFIRLQSDTGQDYSYNRLNAVLELEDYGDHFTLDIDGNEIWTISFYKPSGHARWQEGLFLDEAGVLTPTIRRWSHKS